MRGERHGNLPGGNSDGDADERNRCFTDQNDAKSSMRSLEMRAGKAIGLTREEGPMSPEYTCPMHPQVVRHAPGVCPICGMAFEPRVATAEEQPNTSCSTCSAASSSARF